MRVTGRSYCLASEEILGYRAAAKFAVGHGATFDRTATHLLLMIHLSRITEPISLCIE